MRLYRSLALRLNHEIYVDEAPYLCGFTLGNTRVPGCLTSETDSKLARIHSCEPGVVCSTISSQPSVYITPIVTRDKDGSDILELGAGGGLGDLTQNHQLQFPDSAVVDRFVALCSEHVQEPTARQAIIDDAVKAFESKSKSLSLNVYGIKEEDEITLERLLKMLSQGSKKDVFPGRSSATSRLPDIIVSSKKHTSVCLCHCTGASNTGIEVSILPSFLLWRTLWVGWSFSAQRCLSLHCRSRKLDGSSLDGKSLWPFVLRLRVLP